MNKKTTIIFSLIIAVTLLLAACANGSALTLPEEQVDADLPSVAVAGAAPNNDAAIVVMVVNGVNVYKDKFNAAYSTVSNNLGLSEDDTSFAYLLKQSANRPPSFRGSDDTEARRAWLHGPIRRGYAERPRPGAGRA